MLEGEPCRLPLAHTPTPLAQLHRLSQQFDCELWIKRDDMTGGPEAGNKIRKLEYLLADAKQQGCDTIITCGGIQSNHARATALLGAQLGLRSVLLLRVTDLPVDAAPLELTGNVLLDRLAGANVVRISVADYRERHDRMAAVAADVQKRGGKPYVIPEGGSNGLGAFGYVRAAAEIRRQLDVRAGRQRAIRRDRARVRVGWNDRWVGIGRGEVRDRPRSSRNRRQ